MTRPSRPRAALKFLGWLAAAASVFAYAIHTYTSGTMARWYYYEATADGYAVSAKHFAEATPERPASLIIGEFAALSGLQAVPVRAGQVLPRGATGVIGLDVLRAGTRVRVEGPRLVVLQPWQVGEAKGFTFREGFSHKNVRANPISGVWNLIMVMLMGLTLGFTAEGFTDLIGVRLRRSDHTVDRGGAV